MRMVVVLVKAKDGGSGYLYTNTTCQARDVVTVL